ncbi:MAG: ABC transporter substrate-binding protein [Actinobacteria bacterium]|nr:ABC transporter substrate-binding protein [Actinomycetota bacterium]
MRKLLVLSVLITISAISVLALACGGTGTTATTAAPTGSPTTAAGGGEVVATSTSAVSTEPIKIAFDEGFTGFMAFDAAQCDKGILTALSMLDNQMAGRPVKYSKVDNSSDPVIAVDKAKQLVTSGGLNYMIGPLFSPATQAVTDYLAKSGGIPDCSLMGQPKDNLTTANKLAFIPAGLYGSWGYYFGKYVAEELGYKTANCINYEDTAAHDLQAGFERGFGESGGKVISVNYVPMDTVDFSPYLSTLKPADCTYFWIIGNGSVPFVKQCSDYNLTAPLVVPMANNFVEEQLAELGDAGLNIVGCDVYTPLLDNALNKEYTAAYQKLYPDELPTTQSYTGWVAVMLYNEALKQTRGDTTPAKVIEAMANMSIDTPAGKVTMSPYKDAYIGTRDFLIVKTQKVGNNISWVPIYTYSQVQLGE